MARGRHAKRSGLLARLFPRRAARRQAAERQRVLLRQVADELRALRALADAHAGAAGAAEQRARLAEQRAAAAQAATAALQQEVARLREELVWAWAEGRLPAAGTGVARSGAARPDAGHERSATVVDLHSAASAQTA